MADRAAGHWQAEGWHNHASMDKKEHFSLLNRET